MYLERHQVESLLKNDGGSLLARDWIELHDRCRRLESQETHWHNAFNTAKEGKDQLLARVEDLERKLTEMQDEMLRWQ